MWSSAVSPPSHPFDWMALVFACTGGEVIYQHDDETSAALVGAMRCLAGEDRRAHTLVVLLLFMVA